MRRIDFGDDFRRGNKSPVPALNARISVWVWAKIGTHCHERTLRPVLATVFRGNRVTFLDPLEDIGCPGT